MVFFLAALILLWMYSYRPLSLSYRGGGEVLQMLGVGVVLPLFGYYIQAGGLAQFPYQFLLFILPSQLACAFSTTLPDFRSDRMSRKRTLSVLLGCRRVARVVLLFQTTALVILHTHFAAPLSLMAILGVLWVGMAISSLIFAEKQRWLAFVSLSILLTTVITLTPIFLV